MSWIVVKSFCEKRRRYISLYSSSLESGAAAGSKVQNQEIKDLDAQLEPEVRPSMTVCSPIRAVRRVQELAVFWIAVFRDILYCLSSKGGVSCDD
jgi:hypothetical protein